MARILVLLLCLSASPFGTALAEGGSSLNLAEADAPTRSVLLRAMIGGRLKLRLQANVVLVGSLKGVSDSDCRFHVEGEKEPRTFALDAIQTVEHFAASAQPRQTAVASNISTGLAAAIEDGQKRLITLTNYRSYTGRVQPGTGKASVKVELADGVVVEIPTESIQSVDSAKKTGSKRRSKNRRKDRYDTEDPNRTRYLFAPSAMMLPKGDGYFSQKQLAFSEFAYGVHENVTILVGGILPAWLIVPPAGFNLSFGAKFGWEIAENFHWAAGVYGLLLPGFGNGDVGGGGFLFTTITGGNERYHGSLSVGFPLVFGEGEEFFDPILVASGNVRVSSGLAFVSENWIFPAQIGRGDSFASIHSLALRFITDAFATDVGLVSVPGFDNDVPLLPWLDFTYNWGSSH